MKTNENFRIAVSCDGVLHIVVQFATIVFTDKRSPWIALVRRAVASQGAIFANCS